MIPTPFQEACRAEAMAYINTEPRARKPTYRHLRASLTNPYGLTHKEREVVVCVAEGLTNAEIGRLMGVTEQTVKFHVGRVMDKMECRRRVQLAVKWVREQEK
jgi:DNA-binding CsgD family transcriptional regulator